MGIKWNSDFNGKYEFYELLSSLDHKIDYQQCHYLPNKFYRRMAGWKNHVSVLLRVYGGRMLREGWEAGLMGHAVQFGLARPTRVVLKNR